jgi:hypothetical protein
LQRDQFSLCVLQGKKLIEQKSHESSLQHVCHGLSWHSGQPNVLSMSCTNFSIYLICLFREQDQWIQCDDCSKWRRLPLNVIVASKWTCADNTWDPKRYDYFTPVIESINFYMPKDRSGIYDNPYAVQ